MIKGNLTRDFWLQVVFRNQFSGDILTFVFFFIAGVNDTGDKLSTGVNDTSAILSLVLLLADKLLNLIPDNHRFHGTDN